MGVYQMLTVCPDRIPDDQWEEVYEEALRIVERCDLLDRVVLWRNDGQRLVFARKTAERNLPEGGPGICICGTMASGADMEEFTLCRRKPRCHSAKGPDNGVDILFEKQWSDDPDIPEPNATCTVWSAKTQGGPGHIPLLAVACLFASRFPEAVMIDGDITAGQCRAAVRLANQCLDRPVQVPVMCRAEALIERLQRSGIPARKQLEAFFRLYLGKLTPIVGGVLRKWFPKEELYRYFRGLVTRKERREETEEVSFTGEFRDYLLLELELGGLLKMLVQDPDGPRLPLEKVLSEFFDCRVHIPMEDKNSFDPLGLEAAVDGDEEEPHDIEAIMGRFFFTMSVGRNRNLPVYVPLEKIRGACRQVFPGEDTDALIDRLLEELKTDERQEKIYGSDDTSGLNLLFKEAEAHLESKSAYDIQEFKDLYCWRAGLTMEPELEKTLLMVMRKVRGVSAARQFPRFLALDRVGRENFFVRNNHILLRETTWERIFDRLMDDSYIYRFFLLFAVDCSPGPISDIMGPLLSQPDLIDMLWEQTADEAVETESQEKSD